MSENEQQVAEAVGREMYKFDSAAQMLGIMLDDIGPGSSRMSMNVRADMLNGHGSLHGGMTFLLADTAFAYACNSRNHRTVALACAITYVSAGREGDVLTAVATEQALTGKTGIYDITVTNGSGKVVAMFRGNSYKVGPHVVADEAFTKLP